MDFAVPSDHSVTPKESKNKDKYQDLTRELKKLWSIKMTVITILVGALGLIKRLEDVEIRG